MVDTRDLKSLGLKGCTGSSPVRGTLKTLFITGVFDSPFFREEYDLR